MASSYYYIQIVLQKSRKLKQKVSAHCPLRVSDCLPSGSRRSNKPANPSAVSSAQKLATKSLAQRGGTSIAHDGAGFVHLRPKQGTPAHLLRPKRRQPHPHLRPAKPQALPTYSVFGPQRARSRGFSFAWLIFGPCGLGFAWLTFGSASPGSPSAHQ